MRNSLVLQNLSDAILKKERKKKAHNEIG